MILKFLAILGCCFVMSLNCSAAETPKDCTLKRVAVLDADLSGNHLTIDVQIDGQDAKMLVDTGSPFNMISRRLADELKLPLRQAREGAVIDAAGKSARHYVTIHKLTLGEMSTTRDMNYVVMGEDQSHDSDIDGIFGAEILAAYDVELDLAHGKLSLFMKDHCPGKVVYWTQDYVEVPFTLDGSLHVTFKAELEGHPLRALLDTGASLSILSAQTARRLFDFDPGSDMPPDGYVFAGGGTDMPFYRHRFGLLDIAGVGFRNTEFEIVADKASRVMREHAPIQRDFMNETLETPLVIGLHHLVKLRAYIAYDERVLYVSAANAH